MANSKKKYLTVVIEYEQGDEFPSALMKAFADEVPFHGIRITGASLEDEMTRMEGLELELELENGPEIVRHQTSREATPQQIADILFDMRVVTHNDLNDTQSGCVQLNRLDQLVETVEHCMYEIERQNKQ